VIGGLRDIAASGESFVHSINYYRIGLLECQNGCEMNYEKIMKSVTITFDDFGVQNRLLGGIEDM
jgi:hypothetical protein